MIADPAKQGHIEDHIGVFSFSARATFLQAFAVGSFMGLSTVIGRLLAWTSDQDPSHRSFDYILMAGPASAFFAFALYFLWAAETRILLTRDSISWNQRLLFGGSITLPLDGIRIEASRNRRGDIKSYILTNICKQGKRIVVTSGLYRFEEFGAMLSRFTGQDFTEDDEPLSMQRLVR